MLDNPGAVTAIYAIGGSVFLVALAMGALTTLGRVLFYREHRRQRPRLLSRDAIVYGGLTISFGAIAAIRFLPPAVRLEITQGNVVWAFLTTVPAVIAVVTYLYFELFVIERGES